MGRSVSISGHQQVQERRTLHGLEEGSEDRDQGFKAPFGAMASLHANLGAYTLSWMTAKHELKPALHARDGQQLLRHVTAATCLDLVAEPHISPAGLERTNKQGM